VSLDVEMLTVGPVAENCFLLPREGEDRVLVVDPGEEAERILAAAREMGELNAILITHCHFDYLVWRRRDVPGCGEAGQPGLCYPHFRRRNDSSGLYRY
jgi:metallo-beta-lactamase superfamily protein